MFTQLESGSKKKDIENESRPGLLDRFFMKVVLGALTSMKLGKLVITLPDGKEIYNDSSDSEIVASINIHSYNFFNRCVKYGAIGFAESFIEEEWTTADIADVIRWFILNQRDSTVMEGSSARVASLDLLNFINRIIHWTRPNSMKVSKENISAHYDLSNDMFKLFLDPSMTYSSGIFKDLSDSLNDAQMNKYERICRSLNLASSDQVLEIGCGWGGFAIYAASKYGCKVTGVTISRQQYDYAIERVKAAGLEDRIEIQLRDFREVTGKFDKIVSIEMVEALGDDHVDIFFARCSELLTENGLLAIQMITSADNRYEQLRRGVDFIQKHIFPGSLLLSIERVVRATHRTSNLQMLGLFDFAESYAHTLHLWSNNFEANLEEIKAKGFDDRFVRKWFYYFAYCEAAFDMRQISVVQLVMTRPNNAELRKSRRIV